MTHNLTLSRFAYCELEAQLQIEADSREEAEAIARSRSEAGTDIPFTLTSIDLTSVMGSSQVKQ